MKKFILLFAMIVGFSSFMIAQVTVHVSGTVTRDSTNLPVVGHEVIITADSNPSGFTFWAQRFTNATGFYDCTIHDVPGGVETTFIVKTKNCDSTYIVKDFQTSNSPATENFVLCNTPANCEAGFTYHADSTNPHMLHFDENSYPAGQIHSWVWDFGDGTPTVVIIFPANPNVTHTYAGTALSHTVCLTITTFGGCTSTKCSEVHIIPPAGCEAGFSAYADSANLLNIHFQDNSAPAGQIIAWSWNFGDGGTSSTPDPWHIYATAGTYNVCLTIAASTGCTSVKCVEIHAGQPVGCEARFEFTVDSVNGAPYTYHFFDTSTGNPTTREWHFGDPNSGTSNLSHEKNPTHVYASAGFYNVCLSIIGVNCQSYTCDSIHVGSIPGNCESSFTYGRNFLTVNFEGHTNSQHATTWTWNFGDPASGNSNFSHEKNSHHTYSAPGSYTVTLQTVDANNCTWSSTQTIYVSTTCDVFGHVLMGNNYVDHGLIDLIRIDSGNVMTIVQSHEFGDSLGMYSFGGVLPGHYYLRAQLLPNSTRYGDFMPTYFEEAINWTNAHIIELGPPNNPYNFHLVEAEDLPPGNGSIVGTITQGTKVSSGGTPAQNVEVLLLNSTSLPLAVAVTDVNGHFEFSSIGMGTYIVYPEVAGLATTPALVILDNANPAATTPFSMNSSQVIYGINDQLPLYISRVSNLWPNPPSNGLVSISVSVARELEMNFTLIDQTGQIVRELQQNLHKGDNILNFNVADLAIGPYYLKMRTEDGGNIFRKLFIVK